MSYVERLVINNDSKATILYDEHIIRYQFVAPYVADKVILDIASGSGYGVAFLADAGATHVIGIDVDEQAVSEARTLYKNPAIEFRNGDATKLDLQDNSIDIITSFETIEHLSDPEKCLSELKRVLRPDGLVFISTPNRTLSQEKNPFHTKEFDRKEFASLLKGYFSEVKVFDQKNGLASVISGEGQEGTVVVNDQASEPIYFLAVCSNKALPNNFKTVTSINVSAHNRRENNPAWKLVNAVYKLFHKS